MIKPLARFSVFSTALVITIYTFTSFYTTHPDTLISADQAYALEQSGELALLYDPTDRVHSPELNKGFNAFKEALAFKESQGDYSKVNSFGYLGKYQFGISTLQLLGVNDATGFLQNPELQEKTFIANTARNKWILKRDINRFVGTTIDGIKVTESGILAAAHLAGPGAVKDFLRSNGEIGFKDAYGTSIRNYLRSFAGYDTSFIEPIRTPRVL